MKQRFDADKFMSDRQIDLNDIGLAMSTNADLLGFYGYQESLWDSFVDHLKLQLDNTSSEAELNVKSEGEKITEATAKAKVANDPDVRKYKKALLVAREQASLYSTGVRAIEQRGKMLISLGAWLRAEMDQNGMSFTDSGRGPTYVRMPADRRQELVEKAQRTSNPE